MKIVDTPIGEIRPYEKNPRKNDKAVAAVVESIRQFDWAQPIVVDAAGVIIVGHTRYKAALQLGLEKVPVFVASHLSEEDARRYRIADNKTGELADWDEAALMEELAAGSGDPRAWLDLGFKEGELAELLVVPGKTDPNAVPEKAEFVTTVAGDLWVLGDHRLLCGSSTVLEDVQRLMDGDLAALCATDPPYLVEYTGKRVGGTGKDWSATYREIEIDDASVFFLDLFTVMLEITEKNAALYCWHAHKRVADIIKIWDALDILNHQEIIWVKPCSVFGSVFYHFRHEPCIMGWRRGSKPHHNGRHDETSVWTHVGGQKTIDDMSREELVEFVKGMSSVWEVDWEGKSRIIGNEHPTQKPIELFVIPMQKHTTVGDIVYEPFSGSGSQLIAAQTIGRHCRAMEIEPTFVDVAVRRWQNFTGLEAVHEETGKTWAALRKSRRAAEQKRKGKKKKG